MPQCARECTAAHATNAGNSSGVGSNIRRRPYGGSDSLADAGSQDSPPLTQRQNAGQGPCVGLGVRELRTLARATAKRRDGRRGNP